MNVLVTSSRAVLTSTGGEVDQEVVTSLKQLSSTGLSVVIISNHPQPIWFNPSFAGSNVLYWNDPGRQSGEGLKRIATHLEMSTHDILVLACSKEDVQMAKNGGAVLIPGWRADAAVSNLGIKIGSPAELASVLSLVAGWHGGWWFRSKDSPYPVLALADLSSYGKAMTQQQFSEKVVHTIKQGGHRLTALLTTVSRSILSSNVLLDPSSSLWGVYPSSNSANDDTDVLSDFTHRLRTTVSRVHLAKRGVPLFVRHTPSPKRSAGGGGDRTDPTSQLNTLHLNPHYRGKLFGRTVVVVDDVTTYGVSFGVAASLLRKAGAKQMIGIALGKFGSQLKRYEIDILGDPFDKLFSSSYAVKSKEDMQGVTDSAAQGILLQLV